MMVFRIAGCMREYHLPGDRVSIGSPQITSSNLFRIDDNNPCMILCPHHLHNYPDTIYYEVACELFDEYGTASLEVRRARPPLPYGNNMGTFFPPTSSRHFRHICSRQILAILLAMIVEPQRFALQNQSFLHAIPPRAWR